MDPNTDEVAEPTETTELPKAATELEKTAAREEIHEKKQTFVNNAVETTNSELGSEEQTLIGTATENRDDFEDNEDSAEEEAIQIQKPKKVKYNLKEAMKNRFSVGEFPKQIAEEDVALETQLNEDFAVLESMDDTGSESSFMESIIGADTVNLKTQFLKAFDELPDISDISEEQEEEQMPETVTDIWSTVKSTRSSRDTGVFVDPLTGEAITDESSTSKSTTSELLLEDTAEEDEADDDLDLLLPYTEMPPIELEKEEFDIFAQLKESTNVLVFEEDEGFEAKVQKREVQAIAYDFMISLLDEVVNQAELMDGEKMLSLQLNKEKLMPKLISEARAYQFEKLFNQFLCGKLADYLKRTKSMRGYLKLTPEAEPLERSRYLSALLRLDYCRKKAKTCKRQNALLMSSVLMDLKYVQNIAMYTEIELENRIRKSLNPKDSQHLKVLINRTIERMSDMRNEISDTRLFLITRKHTLGRILARISKFEQITEDLTMSQFITIQTEVQALDKKLEERSAELKKCHRAYHADLHVMSHSRENAEMLGKTLSMRKAELEKVKQQQSVLRQSLYKLKLERAKFRKRQRETIARGGLLANPNLMYDFDNTVKYLEQKKESVLNLKQKMAKLVKRIEILRKSFVNDRGLSTSVLHLSAAQSFMEYN